MKILKAKLPLIAAIYIVIATVAYAELLFSCNIIAYDNAQRTRLAINSGPSQMMDYAWSDQATIETMTMSQAEQVVLAEAERVALMNGDYADSSVIDSNGLAVDFNP